MSSSEHKDMTELECEMMLYEEWEKESKEAERVYLRNLAAKIQEKDHYRPNGQETENALSQRAEATKSAYT